MRQLVSAVCWALVLLVIGSPTLAAEPKEVAHGLKTEIFGDTWFQRKLVDRIDPNIECYWEEGSPAPNVPVDNFSVRWTGWLRAPKAGRYKLVVHCDDGLIMRLNGVTVIERREKGVFTEEANVELSEIPVPFSLDYFELELPAYCVMFWQPVGAPAYCPVPPEAFFPDHASIDPKAEWKPSEKAGLVAEYFDKNLTRRLKTDRAVRTEAIWGDGAPIWGLPVDVACRYSGYLVPEVTGKYTFVCVANDHARLWINGKPVLEAKYGQKKPSTAVVDLIAKKPVAIRIEFVGDKGWDSYSLQWIRPLESHITSIPTSCLYQSKAAIPKEEVVAP